MDELHNGLGQRWTLLALPGQCHDLGQNGVVYVHADSHDRSNCMHLMQSQRRNAATVREVRGSWSLIAARFRQAAFNLEGSAFNPEGSAFNPEGSAFNPEGSAFNPEGLAFNPEGLAFNPEGLAFNPEGSAFNPEGLAFNREGLRFNREGLRFNLDSLRFNLDGLAGSSGGSWAWPKAMESFC